MYTIIMPVDGSPAVERRARFAADLARRLSGRLELIGAATPANHAARHADLTAIARGIAPEIPVTVRAATSGDPRKTLLAVSRATPDAIVILGDDGPWARRDGGLSALENRLLQQATTMLARLPAGRGAGDVGSRDLLVPLDGSPLAERALPLAARIAQEGATIRLLHVAEPGPGATDDEVARLRERGRAHLDQIGAELRARGVRVSWEVRVGSPGAEILRTVETTATRLVVMTAHGGTVAPATALGHVSRYLLPRLPCPSILIPRVTRESAGAARGTPPQLPNSDKAMAAPPLGA